MQADRWQRIKSVFAAAVDLDAEARERFLRRECAGDAALLQELDSLLKAHAISGGFIEQSAAEDAVGLEVEAQRTSWIGRRVGVYRITEEIGRGGMSEVYKAIRADDEYHKEVAVKVLRGGFDSRSLLERFRIEKQILATLDHPNIARLLDGGSTEEGLPYLVMDYIQGLPVDDYCTAHRFGVRQRLELFLTLCNAVQYVHQHLMVHGDLKCSNVLVSGDGMVKLLDFGIARVLTPVPPNEPRDPTPTALVALTPEYASPEQIRGGPVTTATDVYSLGIVLFRLLTDTLPYRASSGLPYDLAAHSRELEPPVPSAVARCAQSAEIAGWWRQLSGDLDNIVAMALQKDPARRYPSVDELSADLARHLRGFPVRARAASVPYRVAKFMRRNRAALAAAAIVVLTLIGGIIATSREARVAEIQRAKAESRFNDVRKLANSLIFEIHDSIRYLPGAAQARRLLISTALQYLDSLSRDAANDPALQSELASAYARLADVQGQVRAEAESDFAGAARSYQRAISIWQASLFVRPTDDEARGALVRSYVKLGDVVWVMGDASGAIAYSRGAFVYSRSWEHSTSPRLRFLAAVASLDYGYKLFKIRGDIPAALDHLYVATRQIEPLWAAEPNVQVGHSLARSYTLWGEILCYQRRYAEALSIEEKARRMYDELVDRWPNDVDVHHMATFAGFYAADALMNMGRLNEATRYEAAVVSSLEALVATDPKIAGYHGDLSAALAGMADIAGRQGQLTRATELLHQALQELAAAPDAESSAIFRNAKAIAQSQLGDVYAARAADARRTRAQRLADLESANEWYQKARTLSEGLSAVSFEAVERVKRIDGELEKCNGALAAGETRRR